MNMPPHDPQIVTEQQRDRLLVDALTDYAIYMLDQDGFVIGWNVGAQKLKGYTEQEIVGRHFSQFYVPEDVAAGRPNEALLIARRDGRFDEEGWRVRKNGDRFWASVVVDPVIAPDGKLLGFAKVTRELTEWRKAQESLRQSEEQFRLLVQGVTDYAIYLLDPTGIVTNWNAGAQRIKGYRADEVIGTHFSRFYREQDRAEGRPATALAIAAKEGRFEAEGLRVRKDGSEFWANVVIDPIRSPSGEVVGYAKITRDISEKRNAQIALDTARESLFQAQKLDAIGQLTGGVAHDFNNLLMVILTSLQLLKASIPESPRSTRLIDNAMRGAKRGATLTQRMLAFARRQQLAPEVANLADLVIGMRDMLDQSIGASVHLDLDFPRDLRPVSVDVNQFELALLNLAVNGRDAMPDGGTLTISARDDITPHPALGLATGDYVCLTVADTGIGMNAETLGRAMEPFYTTKGVGKGTGLGLPMVHGLASQSGGLLQLHSVLNEGSRVVLWLPVSTDGAAGQHSPIARDPPVKSPALLVLAVDDDLLVLDGIVAILEDLGHTVVSATSGTSALQIVGNRPDLDLVITDQVMPRMTGVELAARLDIERPGLPLLLASGFGESPQDSSLARIAKPFEQAELARAISLVMKLSGDRQAAARAS